MMDIPPDHFPKNVKPRVLQASLLKLDNSFAENRIENDQWCFNKSLHTEIDFGPLRELGIANKGWAERLGIRPEIIAKILFIDINKNLNRKYFIENFNFICKTLFFLAEHDREEITKACLNDYLSYILTYSTSCGAPNIRLNPLAYSALLRTLNIAQWIKTSQHLKLKTTFFSQIFPKEMLVRSLKTVIPVITDDELTFRDWAAGKSLNKLTLDYGRFYIEHCMTLFEDHVSLAIALRTTLNQKDNLIARVNIMQTTPEQKTCCKNLFAYFLLGGQLNAVKPEQTLLMSNQEVNALQQVIRYSFSKTLHKLLIYNKMLSPTVVADIARNLHIKPLSQPQTDCMRHLIEARLSTRGILPYCPSEQNGNVEQWLISLLGIELSLDRLDEAIEAVWEKLEASTAPSIPTPDYYQSLNLGKFEGKWSVFLQQFLANIEHAGVTVFVALTGWRRSEYGFGLKDIQVTGNKDLLDQQTQPWRYEVFWYVPKTNGTTKLHREISHTCYQYALQLSAVTGTDNPCLYSYFSNSDPVTSTHRIYFSVTALWGHYVRHYPPFVRLDGFREMKQLESTAKKVELTNKESQRLARLQKRNKQEKWEELNQKTDLLNAYERSRKELPKVELFLDKARNKKPIAIEFRNRTLPEDTLALLDQSLSESTQEKIQLMSQNSASRHDTTRSVMNEVLGDAFYPTPHAFRHMWAEAVYRRFDGDAGWMIRSTFKHVSQTMWLAYIHEKDNRRQQDKIKRRVCSTLLNNYLRKAGEGYAGALDKLLRRLFLNTHTTKIDNLGEAVERFAKTEIEDIKTNPWGYCIMLRRNQHRARCSQEGTPQKQNACPALCLGCTNNLIQEGNIDGILLNISNDLTIVKTPSVPAIFREQSCNTIKNAIKHLKQLGADHDILAPLQEAIST